MKKASLLKSIMSWILVIAMLLSYPGNTVTLRAAENGDNSKKESAVEQPDTEEDVIEDTTEETTEVTTTEETTEADRDADELSGLPKGVKSVEYIKEELVSGLGEVVTGLSVNIEDTDAVLEDLEDISVSVGGSEVYKTDDNYEGNTITVNFKDLKDFEDGVAAGTELSVKFNYKDEKTYEWKDTLESDAYVKHSISNISVSESNNSYSVKIDTGFNGMRKYVVDIVDTDTGASLLSNKIYVNTTDTSKVVNLDTPGVDLSKKNFKVTVQGVDAYGCNLEEKTSGVTTNSTYVEFETPENVSITVKNGDKTVKPENGKYNLCKGESFKVTIKADASDGKPVIDSISDNDKKLDFKLDESTKTAKSKEDVYTQTDITIDFNNADHKVKVTTKEATAKCSLLFKVTEFYPTYKYTVALNVDTATPANAVDMSSVEFSTSSDCITIADKKKGEFEVKDDVEAGTAFAIKATYKLFGQSGEYSTEDTKENVKEVISTAQFEDFGYKYVDGKGNEISAFVNNEPVWVNVPVYLLLMFNSKTNNVSSYRVNDNESYISVENDAQKKVYNNDGNLFDTEEKVTVTTRARGDNSSLDSSSDENNYKYNTENIDVKVDCNAPEVDKVSLEFETENGTTVNSDCNDEGVRPAAYRKKISVSVKENESGLLDTVIYSNKELTDIKDTTRDSVDKLLEKYKNSTLAIKDGKFELELNSKDNGCMDSTNVYYFYIFDKAGNCKVLTEDIGALPTLNDCVVTFAKDPVEVDNEKFVTSGNSVSMSVSGICEDYQTDISKTYGETTPYIKFFYKKDNGSSTQIKSLNIKNDLESNTCEIEGKFDIPKQSKDDGKYTVYIEVQDSAGNKVSGEVTFEVDNTAPVISADKLSKNEYLTDSKSKKWDIKTKEKNLEKIEVVSVKVQDVNGDDTETAKSIKKSLTYNSSSVTDTSTKWKSSTSDTYTTGSYTIPVEARYTLTLKATDVVGNTTTLNLKFCYDVESAAVSEISLTPIPTGIYYTDYKAFSNDTIALKISASDSVSGLQKIFVDFSCDDKTNSDEINTIEWTSSSLDVYEKTISKKIDKNFKGTIKVKVYDNAGNVYESQYDSKYQSGATGFINEDETLHSNTASVVLKANTSIANQYGNTYYYGKNEDVKLSISAKDTFSGIRTLVYNDTASNKETLFNCSLQKNESIKKKYTGNRTIKSSSENEGLHKVRVDMADNSGNKLTSGAYQKYVIDTIAPVISCTYSTNNSGNIYTSARTAHISINETNFDSKKVTVTVTKNGTSSVITNKFIEKNGVYVMDYTFSEDADYVLKVSCKDKADNKAKDYVSEEFTIDETLPTLDVSYDNNSAQNGTYYKAGRIATIKIEEHNFDASNVSVNVTSSDGTSTIPGVGAFSSNGDVHTATVNFASDGDYRITVTVKDRAGNAASNSVDDSFIIDTTAPEIDMSDVEAAGIYTDSITPSISVTDKNYNKDGVSVSVAGARGTAGNEDVVYSTQNISNGVKYVYSDFKKIENVDDEYTLTVKATDMAGNEATKEISFKVDRFGSYFVLGKVAQTCVDQYYTNMSAGDVVIDEYNVVGFSDCDVYYTVGDKVVNLSKDEYTVQEGKASNGWSKRSFIIPAALFTEEGNYSIVVHTKDAAGKETDNEVKDASVKFCIDWTAPEYYISGVEDGGEYEQTKSVDASISFHDNLALGYAEVTVDGQMTRYEAKDIETLGGQIEIKEIKASSKKHSIKVVCYDAAGNEAVDNNKEITFTVSNNALQAAMAESGSSMLWIILLIIAIILVAAVIFIVVRRKSSKEN